MWMRLLPGSKHFRCNYCDTALLVFVGRIIGPWSLR
jgi:LSD1 subclass zinc finger protein